MRFVDDSDPVVELAVTELLGHRRDGAPGLTTRRASTRAGTPAAVSKNTSSITVSQAAP